MKDKWEVRSGWFYKMVILLTDDIIGWIMSKGGIMVKCLCVGGVECRMDHT